MTALAGTREGPRQSTVLLEEGRLGGAGKCAGRAPGCAFTAQMSALDRSLARWGGRVAAIAAGGHNGLDEGTWGAGGLDWRARRVESGDTYGTGRLLVGDWTVSYEREESEWPRGPQSRLVSCRLASRIGRGCGSAGVGQRRAAAILLAVQC